MGAGEADRSRPARGRPDRIVTELKAAKMVRAVWSERQLQEVMVDFWFNHFNVYARKGAVRWMITAYERDAIRPHALGRFEDLLLATARHPAMLFYLDNWLSVRPDLVARRPGGGARPTGLNENYARELLELHTVGVDGGYSQQDVVEVARCFSGWSIDRPRQEGQFVFRALAHDDGIKRVLGRGIPAGGGELDGIRAIAILARHPATARFIAVKLARRFVSDEPPPAVVAQAAETFRRTDGDIRQVLAAIVGSPDFWSAAAYRAKIKKPVELVASATRAVGARPAEGSTTAVVGMALARAAGALGEAPYEAAIPTGYGDTAVAWVSAGALLARMNFALDLTRNRVRGVSAPVDHFLTGTDRRRSDEVLDRLLAGLLSDQATASTRAVLARHLADPEDPRATADNREPADPERTDAAKIAALVLGSPGFQRR